MPSHFVTLGRIRRINRVNQTLQIAPHDLAQCLKWKRTVNLWFVGAERRDQIADWSLGSSLCTNWESGQPLGYRRGQCNRDKRERVGEMEQWERSAGTVEHGQELCEFQCQRFWEVISEENSEDKCWEDWKPWTLQFKEKLAISRGSNMADQ